MTYCGHGCRVNDCRSDDRRFVMMTLWCSLGIMRYAVLMQYYSLFYSCDNIIFHSWGK